mgnify:CR=1 FL=1
MSLPYTTLEGDAEEFLRLDSKLHGEFVQDLLGVTIDDQIDCIFGRNATLQAVEELILGYFRRSRFVLDDGIIVVHIDVGVSMCAASVAEQQAIARGVVACARSPRGLTE